MGGRRVAVTERIEQWRGEGEAEPTLTPHRLVSSIINPRLSGQLKIRLPPLLNRASHRTWHDRQTSACRPIRQATYTFWAVQFLPQRLFQRFAQVDCHRDTHPRTYHATK